MSEESKENPENPHVYGSGILKWNLQMFAKVTSLKMGKGVNCTYTLQNLLTCL